MNSRKITEADIADLKISALPTRPTAPSAFGGKGYTAAEINAAFDRLPLYIIERYNELIEDINNGNFIQYLESPEGTLSEYLLKLRSDIDKIAERLNLKL